MKLYGTETRLLSPKCLNFFPEYMDEERKNVACCDAYFLPETKTMGLMRAFLSFVLCSCFSRERNYVEHITRYYELNQSDAIFPSLGLGFRFCNNAFSRVNHILTV